MKKTFLFLVVVLIASMLLTAATNPKSQVTLKVINKTDGNVAIQLKGYGDKGQQVSNYYLTTKKEWINTFYVDRNIYDRTTWACGFKSTGKLNMLTNVKLDFIPCWGNPTKLIGYFWDETTQTMFVLKGGPNSGEPTMEKVKYYYWYTVSGGVYKKFSYKLPVQSGGFWGADTWWRYRY